MKIIFILALLFFPGISNAQTNNPVVVELYTSQGCIACPPADELLGKLAKEKDLIALSFHVDYWDQMGWKDPYSLADATTRQRDYSVRLGRMYTPQMIFNGDEAMPGTSEEKVYDEIEDQRKSKNPVTVDISKKDGKLFIKLIPAEGMRQENVDIWLVRFQPEAKTEIRGGENDGKILIDHNVVRSIKHLAVWNSEPKTLETEIGKYNVAVIVQEDKAGRVLGAKTYKP